MATRCTRCLVPRVKGERQDFKLCKFCRVAHAKWQRENYAMLREHKRCGRCGERHAGPYASCPECRAYLATNMRAVRARRKAG